MDSDQSKQILTPIKWLLCILIILILTPIAVQGSERGRKPFDNVNQIKKILETGHWGEKRLAARDLGKMEGIEPEEKIDILLKALEKEIQHPAFNKHVRGTGYATITESLKIHYMLGIEDIGASIIPILQEKLQTAQGELRKRIQITLGSLGNKDVYLDVLDILLYEKNGYIRAMAARTLGDIGNEEAIPLLLKALHDPFAVPSGVDIIIPGLDTSITYPVRTNAAGALRGFGIKVHSFEHEHYVIDERFDNYLEQKELLDKAHKEYKEREKEFIKERQQKGEPAIVLPSPIPPQER